MIIFFRKLSRSDNIAENIYFDSELNDICGIAEKELEAVVQEIVDECGYDPEKTSEALDLMRSEDSKTVNP